VRRVHRVGNGAFCRDHSAARETGFSLPKVLSVGFSGETSGVVTATFTGTKTGVWTSTASKTAAGTATWIATYTGTGTATGPKTVTGTQTLTGTVTPKKSVKEIWLTANTPRPDQPSISTLAVQSRESPDSDTLDDWIFLWRSALVRFPSCTLSVKQR
jgi:hypothetical protein